MVDIGRPLHSHAHLAGLKRFSARASSSPSSHSPRHGCFSFAPLARTVIDRLRRCHVQIASGLSDEEFSRIEAPLAFTFPPDLKAILQEGLPVGAGFPDWRSAGLKHLRLNLNLPIAGLAYEVARGRVWLKQWGPKPLDTEQAVHVARAALRKAPILIPVYRYCYIPASPNLAGNPVFFVCQQDVFYCGYDLANFFERENFASLNYELPSDFASLDRTANLGRRGHWATDQNGQSLRFEKLLAGVLPTRYSVGDSRIVPLPQNGSAEEGEEEDFAEERDKDTLPIQVEQQLGGLEAWGRNLDALAKRNDPAAVEMQRRSLELLGNHRPTEDQNYVRLDRRYPSAKATPQLPKSAIRRIEFWSDLAEKHPSKINECSSADHLFSCVQVDEDMEETASMQQLVKWSKHAPYWLERYLDEMENILRAGGWKEADVKEMIYHQMMSAPPEEDRIEPNSSSSSSSELDRQSIMEGLVLYVNLLSDALRISGWSTRDVAEALDVDFVSCHEQKRPTSIVPPRVAARIGKLAKYVAQL